MQILKDRQLILASKSPRRKELLTHAKIPFTVRIQEVEEIYPADMHYKEVPEFLAMLKSAPFMGDLKDDEIVLCSDTIVVHNGLILGKPKDQQQAVDYVQTLAGNEHTVITGVVIRSKEKTVSFSDSASVTLYPMTKEEINWYVEQYQPMDKAGAYGIQDWIGYVKIEKIVGTYATIMGLPISKVYQELLDF